MESKWVCNWAARKETLLVGRKGFVLVGLKESKLGGWMEKKRAGRVSKLVDLKAFQKEGQMESSKVLRRVE